MKGRKARSRKKPQIEPSPPTSFKTQFPVPFRGCSLHQSKNFRVLQPYTKSTQPPGEERQIARWASMFDVRGPGDADHRGTYCTWCLQKDGIIPTTRIVWVRESRLRVCTYGGYECVGLLNFRLMSKGQFLIGSWCFCVVITAVRKH